MASPSFSASRIPERHPPSGEFPALDHCLAVAVVNDDIGAGGWVLRRPPLEGVALEGVRRVCFDYVRFDGLLHGAGKGGLLAGAEARPVAALTRLTARHRVLRWDGQ